VAVGLEAGLEDVAADQARLILRSWAASVTLKFSGPPNQPGKCQPT
jgi:hypothetical protein